MPTVNTDLERAAFEAWCARECGSGSIEYWMPHRPTAGYKNSRVQDYWTGWLARAHAASSTDARGVDGIDGPRRGPVADGSQTPNDATAIPRAKAGSNSTDARGVEGSK